LMRLGRMKSARLACTSALVALAGCHLLGGPGYYVEEDDPTEVGPAATGTGPSVSSGGGASSANGGSASSSASGVAGCEESACAMFDVADDCVEATCYKGECTINLPLAPGTLCGMGASMVCNGAGLCGDCVDSIKPCAEGLVCTDFRCVGSSCADNKIAGDETDLDCGGSCPGCDNGRKCNVREDCKSRRCVGGVCTACTSADQCPLMGLTTFCEGGLCLDKKIIGSCKSNVECLSGKCESTFLGLQCIPTP